MEAREAKHKIAYKTEFRLCVDLMLSTNKDRNPGELQTDVKRYGLRLVEKYRKLKRAANAKAEGIGMPARY